MQNLNLIKVKITTTPLRHTGEDRFEVLSPTDAQENCFRRNIKITLKQLHHVSVQSPSSGSAFFEFAKVTIVKTVN